MPASRNVFTARTISTLDARRIIDIGCGPGYLLAMLPGYDRLGVDTDPEALEAARALNPDVEFVHQSGTRIPVPDQSFDVAVLSEVIEHVGDENKRPVIDEAHRVLTGGGYLIFTAPFAGLLAFADPLDVKRRLPAIYRRYQRVSGRQPQTAAHIGHKHVSDRELATLFAERFVVLEQRYSGPLSAVLLWILILAQVVHLPERVVRSVDAVLAAENGIWSPRRLACNVRIVARKVG